MNKKSGEWQMKRHGRHKIVICLVADEGEGKVMETKMHSATYGRL